MTRNKKKKKFDSALISAFIGAAVVIAVFLVQVIFEQPTGPTASLERRANAPGNGERLETVGSVVYVTPAGKRYHRRECRYNRDNLSMDIAKAQAKGLTPCAICKPER